MATIPKGEATRLSILRQARDLFNTHGIGITLNAIARHLGVSQSRISNHFPTKDDLFIAILTEYENELRDLMVEVYSQEGVGTLQHFVNMMSRVMDVQFQYRCGIIYLNVLSPAQHALKQHIQTNYERNLAAIRGRMQRMVDLGLIESRLFEEPNWSSFVFVYVNILTQWVIHLDMYDSAEDYQKVKEKYIRGIVTHVYWPYLTEEGHKALANLNYGI